MRVQVGNFWLNGTDRQVEAITPMARHASDVLGTRLRPAIEVSFLPGAQMPKRADGGPSVGFTPSYTKIVMWAAIRRYPVVETFAHEVMHAVPLSKKQKAAILALEVPSGAKWNAPGYAKDGREPAARTASRAVLGVANPPYASYYDYDVPESSDPQLKAAYLGTPDVVEPDPTTPDPTPADPVALQAQIDALEAEQAAILPIAEQIATDAIAAQNAANTILTGSQQMASGAIAIVNLARP